VQLAAAQIDNLYPDFASSVGLARAAVTKLATGAGIAGQQLDDVRVCVSEAVTNAVAHAYPDRKGGPVRVDAFASDEELRVHVGDDGCGLQSESPNPGLGLGVPVMSQLSDGLAVTERAGGGVDVDLRFDLRANGDTGRTAPA
jgi:stage II sporulation protein AB (anti-sigma F factor)